MERHPLVTRPADSSIEIVEPPPPMVATPEIQIPPPLSAPSTAPMEERPPPLVERPPPTPRGVTTPMVERLPPPSTSRSAPQGSGGYDATQRDPTPARGGGGGDATADVASSQVLDRAALLAMGFGAEATRTRYSKNMLHNGHLSL